MQIKDHVVSIETAKRMKELGWNKETLFCAYDTRKAHKIYNQIDGVFIPFEGINEGDPEIETHPRSYGDILKPSEGYNQSEPLALPIISEILEELPECLEEWYHLNVVKDSRGEDTIYHAQYRHVSTSTEIYSYEAATPTEAAALLWCKLVEEGIISSNEKE